MSKLFSSIPVKVPKRNRFNLSHNVRFTGEMGQLIPIMCEPVLPNETWKVGSEHLLRLAPMQAPMMSDVDVYVHYFFVPNRLLWKDWESFITGSKNGTVLSDDELPLYPLIDVPSSMVLNDVENNRTYNGVLTHKSLSDYLGFQTFGPSDKNALTGSGAWYPVDDMPFRAYAKIFDDYYRDENLQDVALTEEWFESGRINATTPTNNYHDRHLVRRRAWKKDYFTSALPWAQKGDDVLLPLQSTAPLSEIPGQHAIPVEYLNTNSVARFIDDGVEMPGNEVIKANFTNSDNSGVLNSLDSEQHERPVRIVNDGNILPEDIINALQVDLSSATATTIRELRRAYAAQKFLERRAVGGTRYGEQNRAMFGSKILDGRLQRAEFLGGSKQPVVVGQVLQTSQTTEGNPLATPAGTATSVGGKFAFKRTFHEYGFVVGIMSIMPKPDYMQGIPRKYLKSDPYDFYWPQFARIGEQDVKNCELFFNWRSAGSIDSGSRNFETFGYTPRYAEYRFCNNAVRGDFKDTLSFWTLARAFSNTPQLNSSFIECNPSNRIWSVEKSDFNHLWIDVHLNISALRPIPKYGEAL